MTDTATAKRHNGNAHGNLRGLREQIERDRDDALQVALDSWGSARRDDASSADLELALSRYDACSQRLERMPEIEVVSEPDLYTRGGRHDFFRDIAQVAAGITEGRARQAEERLRRHAQHEQHRAKVLGELAARGLAAHGIEARTGSANLAAVQTRALSSVAGAGGEMVPPKWITEAWAGISRAACPLKGLVQRIDLPPDTLELHIPRFDSTAGVVPEQVENVNAPDQYSTTDAIVAPVRTFQGDVLLSQQEFDRSPLASDEIVVQDFAENYGAKLQQQILAGTGLNGQLLGLLNVPTSPVNGVPGAQLVTYTSATPTPTAIVQAVGQCAAQISDTRERSPSAVLMRGARWFYLSANADGSGDVSEQRLGTGVTPADTDTGPFGPIASLPVYHDNTIPVDLGAGANQDAIVLVRAKDIILLEEPAGPRFTAMMGTDDAGQMTVVLQWHAYVACVTTRYPSGIGSVQGTGLAVPSGF